MATKTVLIDDLDGKSKATETVPFTFDGVAYEIDLAAKHIEQLQAALEPFIKAARKAGRNAASKAVSDAAEVRAWAEANGHELPARGRLPLAVREAYDNRDK